MASKKVAAKKQVTPLIQIRDAKLKDLLSVAVSVLGDTDQSSLLRTVLRRGLLAEIAVRNNDAKSAASVEFAHAHIITYLKRNLGVIDPVVETRQAVVESETPFQMDGNGQDV